MIAVAISPFTLATALRTPLPPYRRVSPSRSSSASRSPVDAPDGTAPRPTAPSASVTSTSTVGLPRESRISRPTTFAIFIDSPCQKSVPRNSSGLATAAASIGICLETECLLAERPDVGLVIHGDDDDAGVGDGVAAAGFLRGVGDSPAARESH